MPAPPPLTTALREVPPKADQGQSRALMRELFAPQLADRTPAGRRKLVEALLSQADKTADNPSDQFVLLAGAYEAAKEGGALRASCRAAEQMAAAFAVDPAALKADAAARANYAADPKALPDNVAAALEVADALAAADDLAAATRVLAALQGPAAASAPLRADVAARQRDLAALRQAHDRYAQGLDKLKAAPDDPQANRAVGAYLCLTRGRWDDGLPYLARAADPALKAAAAADLARPAPGPAQAAAGDAWWAAADREAGPAQHAARARAATWYADALASGKLTGLARARVEQRLAAVPRPPGPTDRRAPAGPLNVILFGHNKAIETLLADRVCNGGKVRPLSRADIDAVLAAPDPYAGAQLIAIVNNVWRDTPPTQFTPAARDALQRFVRAGGDLAIFEQYGQGNMGVFEAVFGVHATGGTRAIVAVDPDYRARADAAGLSADAIKGTETFNAYDKLPDGSRVLLQGDKDKVVAAIVPFGKGRLILCGTTCDANVIPQITTLFEVAYPPPPNAPKRAKP